jgi:hypothetical protein
MCSIIALSISSNLLRRQPLSSLVQKNVKSFYLIAGVLIGSFRTLKNSFILNAIIVKRMKDHAFTPSNLDELSEVDFELEINTFRSKILFVEIP